MNLRQRAAVMKTHEELSYRIAYHLLGSEAGAVRAALLSLERMLQDSSFFQLDDVEQQNEVRRVTIRCSLLVCREQPRREFGRIS